jgi:hypothetical protein
MLVERGLTQSPTFRRLYEQPAVGTSSCTSNEGPQPWLGLRLHTSSWRGVGDRRFLRITLNIAQLDADAVALLRLRTSKQHAVSAMRPDVADIDGIRAPVSRRIGYRSWAPASRGASTPLPAVAADAPSSRNCASLRGPDLVVARSRRRG